MISKKVYRTIYEGRWDFNAFDVSDDVDGGAVLLQKYRAIRTVLKMGLELNSRRLIHLTLEIVENKLIHLLARPRIAVDESFHFSENAHPKCGVTPVWLDVV